jgi:two-component system chemotaxis response regulator CheB
VVAIGASAGGVTALQDFVAGLRPDFAAPILVVQHIGAHPSILPELLQRAGPLPAMHASEGDPIEPGRIYVAPPDRHLLVEDGALRLSHGPREHHTRPAIDPLFRSVALNYGPLAIGVLMTGWGDDGTAGLQAIKACDGVVLVQNPADAEHPSMPMSALQYVQVDHTFDIDSLAPHLHRLMEEREPRAVTRPPAGVVHEHQMFLWKGDPMEHLHAIGMPSPYVCPDCQGGLWEMKESRPRRFRCHTGHAYTLRSLQETQAQTTDAALWNAIRALEEKELLMREIASGHLEDGNAMEAARVQVLAHNVTHHASALRELIEREDATAAQGAASG